MKKTWQRLAAGLTLATAATTGLLTATVQTAPADTAWGAPATVDDTAWGTPPADGGNGSSGPVGAPADTAWG